MPYPGAKSRCRLLIAGHTGMVGSALVREFAGDNDFELVLPGRGELDLTRQAEVEAFLRDHRVDAVCVAAAVVGGIGANERHPATFIRDNLQIACNLISAAHAADIQDLVFLGSSCVYPKHAAQPIVEEALLTGPLEPTNAPYAIAKIAGMQMCEAFSRQHGRRYRSVMPTNLYGPGDNFSLENGHVLPALLRRFHEATSLGLAEVLVWGSGAPRREFMHVDDLATACRRVMAASETEWQSATGGVCNHVNVGTGIDCTIRELVSAIVQLYGYRGTVRFDTTKPDGTPRKLLDISRMRRLGWAPRIGLESGLQATHRWLINELSAGRPVRGMASCPATTDRFD